MRRSNGKVIQSNRIRSSFASHDMTKEKQYRVLFRWWRQLSLLIVFFLLVVLQVTAVLSFPDTGKTLSEKLDALKKIEGGFTFAVIGDNRAGKSYDDIYRELIAQAMKHNLDFMVHTGDMIRSPKEEYWEHFKAISKAVTVPYFFVVGNHDVEDKKSEGFYKKRLDLPGNELYYSFPVGDSLFIVLDSKLPGQNHKVIAEQYEWLKGVLSSSGNKHKFVFIHHPLFPDKGRGHHYGESLDKFPKERGRLHALFIKHKVTMVFQGHEHLYLRNTVNGITYIISGGGGSPLYAEESNGGFHHFVLVTVDGDTVSGKVIDSQGTVRDTFTL